MVPFFFLFDILQYWEGWKTKLQLFAFLLPKPSYMTSQEFCAFAQQAPYLSCLHWERENIYPSWMNKTCRLLLQFALAFHHVQVMFVKWQRLGCFTYFAWQTYVMMLPESSEWLGEPHWQQRGCSLQAALAVVWCWLPLNLNDRGGGKEGARGRQQKVGPPLSDTFNFWVAKLRLSHI